MTWRWRWRSLRTRRGVERDLDDELRAHIDMRAEELRAHGLSQADALREARRRFGNQAAVRESAQKYVPDQLKAVDAQIAAAKDNLAKGDYNAVLVAGTKITSAIDDLKKAASAQKAETEAALTKAKDAWGSMGADLPKIVDAIRSRVDTLSKSHHLPAGVSKDGLASAK